MFLDITDYAQIVKTDIFTQIIESNDANRTRTELNAQSLMEDYLRHRYDVALIFSAVGSARHKSIVRYMLDIVLYDIHARIQPNNVPQLRIDRYDEAMQWLKDVRDGKLTPDLPVLIDTNTNLPVKSVFVSSNKGREYLDF